MELGQSCPEAAVRAISCIGQDHAGRDALRLGPPDLLKRDLRLGLEGEVSGTLNLFPPLRIVGPDLREI